MNLRPTNRRLRIPGRPRRTGRPSTTRRHKHFLRSRVQWPETHSKTAPSREAALIQIVMNELRQFEQIFDNAGDGLLLLDRHGHVERANRAALRMLNMRMADLLGRPVWQIDRAPPWQHLARAVDDVLAQRSERSTVEIESERVSLRATVTPLNRRADAVIVDLHDISELQQAIEERQRHETAALLAGTTAHKLNQPLTAVIGYLNLLSRTVPATRESPYLQRIESACEEMADIVREIGKITRFETRRYGRVNAILDSEANEEGT